MNESLPSSKTLNCLDRPMICRQFVEQVEHSGFGSYLGIESRMVSKSFCVYF